MTTPTVPSLENCAPVGDPSPAGAAFSGNTNTIGAPGFRGFTRSSAVGGGYRGCNHAAPAFLTLDSARDRTPRAVTFSDLNPSDKAADNIANALNSSRSILSPVACFHGHKLGEIECTIKCSRKTPK